MRSLVDRRSAAASAVLIGGGSTFFSSGYAFDCAQPGSRRTTAGWQLPSPSVRVRLLGTADMVLELRFSTDSTRADLLATSSVVRRRVVDAFREAGLPLPEPNFRRVELQSDRSA